MIPIQLNTITLYLDIDKTERGAYIVTEYTDVWRDKVGWCTPSREIAEALVEERIKYWKKIIKSLKEEWKEHEKWGKYQQGQG